MPVLISGGLHSAEQARAGVRADRGRGGPAGARLARQPVAVRQLLGLRDREPGREEILAELDWVIECAREHLGDERATRYLRKFYPWYVERLALAPAVAKSLQAALQTAPTIAGSRELLRRAAGEPVNPDLAQSPR